MSPPEGSEGNVCRGGHARARTHARVGVVSDSTAGAARPRLRTLVRNIAVAPIVLYQRVISPAIPRRCKYEPTCSRYAVEAVRTFGVGRGLVLAVWRLLRCNPFSYGGYDPVDAQRVFGAGRPSEGL